jgi:hypothetical protein
LQKSRWDFMFAGRGVLFYLYVTNIHFIYFFMLHCVFSITEKYRLGTINVIINFYENLSLH